MIECKKCKEPSSVTLRKKDSYCTNCFVTNTNHKFRSCIGKNKILSSNEKVLICLSGGPGSTVLLDLIYNGLSMDNHKKLRIIPYFLHVLDVENESNNNQATNIIEQCKKYNFDVYMLPISQYMETNLQYPEINTIPPINEDLNQKYRAMFHSMSTTASNDLLLKIKRHLFINVAKLLQCNFIFTAETTTTLASILLSNLSIGRGSQVENDVGFCDNREKSISILRPMREISAEEVINFMHIKQLVSIHNNSIKANSLQSIIKSFVTDLQESFPATISTVCKTADKLGVHYDSKQIGKCLICESDLDKTSSKLTAFEATNFSRTVSNGNPEDLGKFNGSLSKLEGLKQESMFPYISKDLCYGCSKNYPPINKLSNHVKLL